MRKTIFALTFSFAVGVNAQQSDNELINLFTKNSTDSFKSYFISKSDNNILGKTYSADTIYSDFNSNELAANKKYKNKQLRLKVKVSKITDDIFGNIFLSSSLKNEPITSVMFKFMDKDDERFLSLKKGDNVDLTCQFDEFSSLFLSFHKCRFSDQYLDKIFFEVAKNISDPLSENYKPKSKIEASFVYIFISRKDQILSVCRSDLAHCNADKIEKSKFFKKELMPNPFNPETYFDNKFGKGWFKSLPKLPEFD